MPRLLINGSDREFADGTSVGELISVLGIRREGTAVAVNSQIVPRETYDQHMLEDGDSIELIRAIGGG